MNDFLFDRLHSGLGTVLDLRQAQHSLSATNLANADTPGFKAKVIPFHDVLANAIIGLIRQIDIPNGLSAVGYSPEDAGRLAAGAIPQHRVVKLSPRPVVEADLKQLFLDSMTLW